MPLPSDALHVANLLRIARQDLDGARTLTASRNRNAAYLCQQAAEKVARAVAHPEGGHIGREHRIEVILEAIPDANPIEALLQPLQPLSRYATTFRYPKQAGGVVVPPQPQQMALLIERTEAALAAAAKASGVELGAPTHVPAADVSPVRDVNRAPLAIMTDRTAS